MRAADALASLHICTGSHHRGTLTFLKEEKSFKMKLPQVSKYLVSSLSGPLVVNGRITKEPLLL